MGVLQNSINSMLGSAAFVAAMTGRNIMNRQQRIEKANKQAQEAAKAREEQTKVMRKRRDFMKYLKDTVVSFGGEPVRVGDMNERAQKQVASGYTKSQKTALMDEVDKRRKD